MTTTTLPLRIERTYDQEMASDGRSRYGHYVRDQAAAEAGLWDLPDPDRRTEFAALAWRAAVGPVMSPGYVAYHPLISRTALHRSPWDGTLTAQADLRTAPPPGLARLPGWWTWPGGSRPVEPTERDLATVSAGYALTTVTLAFPLRGLALPDPPPGPDSPALAATAAARG